MSVRGKRHYRPQREISVASVGRESCVEKQQPKGRRSSTSQQRHGDAEGQRDGALNPPTVQPGAFPRV
ncbi:hypothetical protein CesoFtcFv8_027386 [Champsocephalus esox]|uniref:Uncharacterized protein n=2 Tax=Champsocephalus TaxID=52236 RepID=A0AAN8BTR6_CHAGU|nr:hypothetical protein CesoFtcFv8_027386 [Champsocephalus esox]KAK5891089.1 hypothetical protein CgunFtcFv8_018380 [Champsocephalus gunnari]